MRPKRHTPDPEAYQLYLQGRRNIQGFTEHGFRQSVVDFSNAIQRDPEYAAAYAGLADAYSYLAASELAAPKDVMPLAESNAAKAIEKDHETAEAYTSLGITAMNYYWDYPLAEQRFRRSLKLNPRDAYTQHYLGHYYEAVGRWSEALNQMRLALSMDKLSPIYGEDLGIDLIANQRIGEAIRQLTETTSLAPADPLAHSLLAIALEADGKASESLAQAGRALQSGTYLIAGSVSGVFCRLGRRNEALEILKQLQAREKAGGYVSPLETAMVQFALGDKAKGLERLRNAVDERSFNVVYNLFDPVFDVVREDPEFAALMNQIHVPEACWRRIPRYLK
jgi:Flp pilus assembly protein TadD